MSEEKIREAIRQRLRIDYGLGKDASGEGRAFRPHGSEHDSKLNQEIPKSDQQEQPEAAAEVPLYDNIEESTPPKLQQKTVPLKDKVAEEVREMLERKKKAKEEALKDLKKEEEKQIEIDDDSESKLKKYLVNRKSAAKK